MRQDLLDLLCCPRCRAGLALADGPWEPEILSGALECSRCRTRYPIQEGMPLLYLSDRRWAVKEREAQGWLAMSKEDGAYDSILDIEYSFLLPYWPDGTWKVVAPYFDAAVQVLALTGSEVVLDLGAGQGWASKHFAMKGCRAVAIDILPDERIGLGRGQAVMERAGVYFERVIGDNENLPFAEGSFDVVFSCSSLHHSVGMAPALKNVARVLKKGGRLIAIEPIIAVTKKESDVQRGIREVSYGIVESRRNLFQMYWYLWRAGLRQISIEDIHTLNGDDASVYRRMEGLLRDLEAHSGPRGQALRRAARRVALRLPRRYATLTTFLLAGGDVIIQATRGDP